MLHVALLSVLTTTPLAFPALTDARRLTNNPSLELRVLDSRGSTLRLEQTYKGLRVLNTKTTAEVDITGRIVSIDRQWKTLSGELPPVKISVAQAMRTAFAKAGVDFDRLPTPTLDAFAELAVLADGSKPRVVYELPVMSVNPFDRLTAVVDATTGEIVRMRNGTIALDTQHPVFDPNPTTAATPVSKTITTNDATMFKGAKIDTASCIHSTSLDLQYYVVPFPSTGDFAQYKQLVELALGKKIDWIVAPLCKEPHTALPSQQYTPVLDQTLPTAKTDQFAEVNFYYHADRVAKYFSTAGAGNLNAGFAGRAGDPLRGTVNFMAPSISTIVCTTAMFTYPADTSPASIQTAAKLAFEARGDQKDVPNFATCSAFKGKPQPTEQDFTAFDNAFFMPALDNDQLGPLATFLGDFRPYDSMIFGQGTIDFAYDASVIYHEYTHGVVNSVDALQDGLAKDKWGLDYAPGAMNEGLADYFASVLTPQLDGCLGPYSAVLMGPGATCLRDLRNEDVCPNYLYGEVHHDSTGFSGALWEIRAGFTKASDQAEFDKAVFEALDAMPNDAQFTHFNHKLLDQMKAHGLATANALEIFAKKNVLDCERAITLKEGDKSGSVNLAGTQTSEGDFAPGFVQYRLEVPPLTKKIEISLKVAESAGGGFDSIPGNVFGGGQQETLDVRLQINTKGPVEFLDYPTSGVPAGAEEVELSKKNKAVFEVKKKTTGPWYVALANYNGGGHGISEVSFTVTDKFEDEKPAGAEACSATVNGWCPADGACVNGTCTEITSDTACSASKPTGLCTGGNTCEAGVCKTWTPPAVPPTSNPVIAPPSQKTGCGCDASASTGMLDGWLVLAAALFVVGRLRRKRD